ncbi:unnamed protein product [Closterium sp. Yama58-4]|nr:unnamed protein product [Closterium sp. Yama58-4]
MALARLRRIHVDRNGRTGSILGYRPDQSRGKEAEKMHPSDDAGAPYCADCFCKVQAILFDEPLTKPLDDITEAWQLLAVKLRQLHDFQFEQCVDPHRGSLDDVYTEEQFRILVSDILPCWAKEYFRESMGHPSQSLWRALAVRVMILMAHHMLGRGVSINEIRYCNMFTHVLPPITNSKGESSIHVLVVAYRNSKTIKDNKLGHLYLTRHMDFRQCSFGAVFMWIHFLFDLVPLQYGNDKIVPPLDFSNPENWSKKHLFFALFDKDKTELPYATHAKWVLWAMKSAEWILSKVTHIFRRSAAQILADKNCELDNIAQLGQWDMNEMRRSYVTGIPRGAIQLQAGFTTEPGDYYIRRSKSEVPEKVLKAIEKHIFPKAEQWLQEAMEWNNEQDKEHMFFAAKSFLKALQAARMPIAEDHAMYYVHCDDHPFDGVTVCDCERHPYAQMSDLCKDMDFQKWALDVYLLDKYGIEMRTNPTMSRASDASFQLNTKHVITQLRAEVNLHKEEGGKKEIKIKHLEQKVESLEREKGAMQAALEAKDEALARLQKAFDALKITAATSAAANVGDNESVPQTATEETTPPTQQAPQTTPTRQSVGSQLDQALFDAVVWPWCNCETVRQAWSYSDGPSPLNNGHSLQHAYRRGFAVKFSKFTPTPPPVHPEEEGRPKEKPPSRKAVESKLRKMEVVMRAVETFRLDDSSAATSTVIEKLDSIVTKHSINMLAEGLVLKEDSGKQLTKKRKVETAEENRKDKDRLRITRELIRIELRTTEWAENVFNDKWTEFMKAMGEGPSSTSNRDEGGN